MKKTIILLILTIALVGCDSAIKQNYSNNYSKIDVNEWTSKVDQSFDKAEKEVFKLAPKPNIDNVVDPDPAKCICRGTGIIVQGDDHKTPCPYHAKQKPVVTKY